MKKDKLYLFTFLALCAIVFVIGHFSINYLVKISTSHLLEIQIESSRREAREFSVIVSEQVAYGIDRETIIKNIQKSIEGTDTESGFICMFDWSGVEICHPNPQKIGNQTNLNESYVRPVDNEIDSEDFYNLLKNKQEKGGVRDFNGDRDSEIIYLYPVKNTDWIIAAHANISKIKKHINQLRVNFLLIYLLTSVVIILLSLFTVRYLGNYYEQKLEIKNEELTSEVINLHKLNNDLHSLKNKVLVSQKKEELDNSKEEGSIKYKNRILTYSKDKLITILVDQIAFIATEHSLTTISCLDGKKYSSNSSLDELYATLDPLVFFRANRQYILSVQGINEILKYGNNQLKINTFPSSDRTIIISKNKASEFKKWLNM